MNENEKVKEAALEFLAENAKQIREKNIEIGKKYGPELRRALEECRNEELHIELEY